MKEGQSDIHFHIICHGTRALTTHPFHQYTPEPTPVLQYSIQNFRCKHIPFRKHQFRPPVQGSIKTSSRIGTTIKSDPYYRHYREMVVEARATRVTKPIASIEDRFMKLEKIGSGAYGVVFRAQDKCSQEVVALKKIVMNKNCEKSDEDGVPSSSLREIGLLKDLRHPNILNLLDIQVCQSNLYLVFEHLDIDLKRLLEKHGTGLPPLVVKSFMWQLLKGLAYCHARRVLHRDLKLQNLLVDRKGNIKLADFGLARSICLPKRTYTHKVVTLWYRSPELLLKTSHYGPSVDIWSLGCIFAEMQTNKTLFPGDSEIDQIYRIFRTLGTPDELSWPDFHKMPEYVHFAKFKSRGIENYIGNHDELAVDLLSKFLAYDPATRISCKQAMTHEYFKDAANIDLSSFNIF